MQRHVSPVSAFVKEPVSSEAAAREARCLDAVAGPGIVPLAAVASDGTLVLDRAVCSLADVLAERGPLTEGEVRAVAVAAVAALARVHAAGLVHGDVKPSNLLLSPDGELWLADFDCAGPADGRPLGSYSPGRSTLGAPARPESDLTALAVTLVELATGSLVDPEVAWRSVDLRRLGCPSVLSADIALLLATSETARLVPEAGDDVSTGTVTAEGAVMMFKRGEIGSLPAPAADVRLADTTPTVDFAYGQRAGHGDASEAVAPAEPELAGAWWRRLAESWRRG